MTIWFLLLLASGLPAPAPADPGRCPDDPLCVPIPFAAPDGAPRAAVLQARDADGRQRDTPLPSLEACLTLAHAYQIIHPDVAENISCISR